MNPRLAALLAAALACTAADLHGQSGARSLPDAQRELTRTLRCVKQSAPSSADQPAPAVQSLPAESYSGPAEEWPVVVMGRVTNPQGQPEVIVRIRIEPAGVDTLTRVDGTYQILVPRDRIRPGEKVTVTASRRGSVPVSRTLVLQPGTRVTQDFLLPLIRLHF